MKQVKRNFLTSFICLCLLACSGEDSNDINKSSDDIETNAPLKALPIASPGLNGTKISESQILGSWTDGEKNWYVIDVGHIERSFVGQLTNDLKWVKGSTPLKYTIKEITQDVVTTNMTQTVSNSVTFTDASTNTNSTDIETAIGLAVEGGIKDVFKISGSLDFTIRNSFGNSKTVSVSRGKSQETSMSNIQSVSVTKEQTREFTLGSVGEATGTYRWAVYAISDVYFVVSTSLDKQTLLSWDVVSCARPALTESFEYSPDGDFDNTPETGKEIKLSHDFYKTLPDPKEKPSYTITLNSNGGTDIPLTVTAELGKTLAELSIPTPTKVARNFKGWYSALSGGIKYENTYVVKENITLYARWTKTETEGPLKYNDTATYTFDKGFPATIHLYALGAGGGGQGGHHFKCMLGDELGRGGGGGGGGATYIQLDVTEQVTFHVKSVGKGGGGGAYKSETCGTWNSAYAGTDGGNTLITWGNDSLFAGGGIRGGWDKLSLEDQRLGGGQGGEIAGGQEGKQGESGTNGAKSGNSGGIGGLGASVSGGGETHSGGSGGNGGYDTGNGAKGDDGQVIIRVTYEVEE